VQLANAELYLTITPGYNQLKDNRRPHLRHQGASRAPPHTFPTPPPPHRHQPVSHGGVTPSLALPLHRHPLHRCNLLWRQRSGVDTIGAVSQLPGPFHRGVHYTWRRVEFRRSRRETTNWKGFFQATEAGTSVPPGRTEPRPPRVGVAGLQTSCTDHAV